MRRDLEQRNVELLDERRGGAGGTTATTTATRCLLLLLLLLVAQLEAEEYLLAQPARPPRVNVLLAVGESTQPLLHLFSQERRRAPHDARQRTCQRILGALLADLNWYVDGLLNRLKRRFRGRLRGADDALADGSAGRVANVFVMAPRDVRRPQGRRVGRPSIVLTDLCGE